LIPFTLHFYQSWQNWILTVFTAVGIAVASGIIDDVDIKEIHFKPPQGLSNKSARTKKNDKEYISII